LISRGFLGPARVSGCEDAKSKDLAPGALWLCLRELLGTLSLKSTHDGLIASRSTPLAWSPVQITFTPSCPWNVDDCTDPSSPEVVEEVNMQSRKWEIFGVPFDHGSEYEGTGAAPEAIREAGLTRRVERLRSQGIDVADRGDIQPPAGSASEDSPKGLTEMLEYAPALVAQLEGSIDRGAIPIVLGGDHSLTVASVAAVIRSLQKQGIADPSVALLWVDAHPDFETPGPHSTNTMNAMPVTHLLGRDVGGLRQLPDLSPSIDAAHLAFIGLRDVLTEEKRSIREMGIRAYTASDVERLGIDAVWRETMADLIERVDAMVLTFDIDALDPMFAPGVDYPELGGLSTREGAVIMEQAHLLEKLALVELVEVNPAKDKDRITARVAGQLLHRLIEGPLL